MGVVTRRNDNVLMYATGMVSSGSSETSLIEKDL